MSKLYNLTKQIHELLPQVKAKYGLEFEVESEKYYMRDRVPPAYGHLADTYIVSKDIIEKGYYSVDLKNGYKKLVPISDFVCCPFIEPPQLLKILVGLQEVLGDSDDIIEAKKQLAKLESKDFSLDFLKNNLDGVGYMNQVLDDDHEWKITQLKSNIKNNFIQTKAEELCGFWLGGLNPLFEREPEKVLKELVEILKNLLK